MGGRRRHVHPLKARLSRREEGQARAAEQQRVQKAVKGIKSPIVITEDDQEATVKAMPEGATHLVDLSPDFEDEEVAEEAVRAQEARDASGAEKKGRAGLAEVKWFVSRQSARRQVRCSSNRSQS